MKYTAENTMHVGKPVEVYLGDEILKDVYEADPEAGYAIVFVRDDEGHFIVQGEDIQQKWVWGDIKVVPLGGGPVSPDGSCSSPGEAR